MHMATFSTSRGQGFVSGSWHGLMGQLKLAACGSSAYPTGAITLNEYV